MRGHEHFRPGCTADGGAGTQEALDVDGLVSGTSGGTAPPSPRGEDKGSAAICRTALGVMHVTPVVCARAYREP